MDRTARLANEWAGCPDRWLQQVRHVDGQRWYLPLFADEHTTAWLITWAPGTVLDLHDHGDASASIAVVQGALTERYGVRSAGPQHLARRVLPAGTEVSFGADHIHEVRNVGQVPAVSIHVYTPRLDHMTFYAEADLRAVAELSHVSDPSHPVAVEAAPAPASGDHR